MLPHPLATHACYASLLLFLATVASALPHGDGHESMHMAGATEATSSVAPAAAATATMAAGDTTHLMSYFRYQKHSGTILAHIVLMAIAWIVILPVGKRSSIIILMRSRRARCVANDWNLFLVKRCRV